MRLSLSLVRVAALAALLGVATLSGAQTPAAKKELVQKALQLQMPGIEAVGNQLAAQTSQQILGAAGQAMGRVAADKREVVGAEIQAEVRKFFEDISPTLRSNAVKLAPTTLGAAMEEKLTEDELKTLVAWLESPVSRKFQQLAGESQMALMQKLVADTRPAVEPKLKVLEKSIAKKLGMPTGEGAAAASAAKSGKK